MSYIVMRYTDEERGPLSYLLTHDGAPVARAGFQVAWAGFAQVWFAWETDTRAPHLKAMLRAVIGVLAAEVRSGRWFRIEAHVEEADAQAVRFARHLGFSKESVLQRWGPGGRDYGMWVILPEKHPEVV